MQDSSNDKPVVSDLDGILEVLLYALKQLYSNERELIYDNGFRIGEEQHILCKQLMKEFVNL